MDTAIEFPEIPIGDGFNELFVDAIGVSTELGRYNWHLSHSGNSLDLYCQREKAIMAIIRVARDMSVLGDRLPADLRQRLNAAVLSWLAEVGEGTAVVADILYDLARSDSGPEAAS